VRDRSRDPGPVRLAYRENTVPFSYLDGGGKPVGYSIDLCARVVDAIKAAVKRPDLKVQYVAVTPATRIAAIKEGRADLECGSTNNTRERREQVAFTIPHYIASSRMLVKTSAGIARWEDLNGKTVVSTRGSTNGGQIRTMAEARVLKINVIEAKDHAEAFGMVEEVPAADPAQRGQARHPDEFPAARFVQVPDRQGRGLARVPWSRSHPDDLPAGSLRVYPQSAHNART
jgi:glutamate/aspartate transport system substrate-binding protein